MTAPSDVLASVCEWFALVELASLELPNGWFGRPYDNLHQLTWSQASTHRVLLELDGQTLLIIAEPGAVERRPDQLLIRDCAQVTLNWRESGSGTSNVGDHGAGAVRFVVPPGREPDARLGVPQSP